MHSARVPCLHSDAGTWNPPVRLGWGGPFVYHPDECLEVGHALRMVATGDLHPHFFLKPTLFLYIQAAVFSVVQYVADTPVSEEMYSRGSVSPDPPASCWRVRWPCSSRPPPRTRLFDRTFWLGSAGIGAASLIGFVLGTSYAVLDFSRFFWHGIACEWNHYSTGHPGQEGTANHWWYLRNTFFHILGPSLSIPALVGLVRSLLRPTRQGCVLLSFPLLYFLFVSSFSARRTWCSLSSNQLLTRSGFTRSFTSVL